MATDGDHIGNTSGDYTSVSINEDEMLANSITEKLPTVSPLSAKCYIFRVPEVLRKLKKKLYEPDVVAIGPYHHCKISLHPMEDVKKRYLHDLLSRTNMTSMLSLIKGIKGFVTRAREYYQETIDVDDKKNKFMEMMIIDGCFLIELFRKWADFGDLNDPTFNMTCTYQHLAHDLLLLENQLPWFIIQTLFDLTKLNDQTYSLTGLVLHFFSTCFSMSNSYEARLLLDKENLHILDLIRDVLVSSYSGTDQIESERSIPMPYLMIPCVTRLLDAGVKFKKGSPGSIIKFRDGIFEIPQLLIHETAEPMFCNLIAFEQCYHDYDYKITSYAVLMDKLINTVEDVTYLVEEGIIVNWLSDEEASKFFNQLSNDILVTKFYYFELFKSVNEYYRTKWHKWRATLVQKYLTTPWTFGGVILMILTFLQTFYSIKQS